MEALPGRELRAVAPHAGLAPAAHEPPAAEPDGRVSGLLLAKQNGAFAAAGLDVDVLDGKGSTTTVQQVAAGQLDIGFGQLGSMAAAVANGIPVTSIMGLVQAGDNGLMVPADSGWKTLSDLKGKRIAVAAGAASTTFFDAFLKGGTSLGACHRLAHLLYECSQEAKILTQRSSRSQIKNLEMMHKQLPESCSLP